VKFRLDSIVVNFAPFGWMRQAGTIMVDTTANRTRLGWLLPLVALVAGYAAGRAHRSPAEPPESREPTAVAKETKQPQARVGVAPDAPDHAALPPMPASHAPLADAFDALAARARAGDGAAAVRLLDATLRCTRFENDRTTAAYLEANPSTRGNVEGRARLAAKARAFVAANEAFCAGATHEQTDTAGEWLPRAAASGDPGAQACYAEMGASDNWLPDYASDAWIDAMRRYRENVRPNAEAAFAAGVPQAAYTLYELSAGRYAMMSYVADSAVAPDYPKAYALALFQAARFDAAETGDDDEGLAAIWRVRAKLLERELSAADIERAKRWAGAEAQRIASRAAPSLPCEGMIGP
jgi:hypothetical protein